MAAPAQAPLDHLRLQRLGNLHFSSWRLSSSIAREQGALPLPAPAAPPLAADTDYVAARHAALLNGLTQQPHGCYTFLEEGEEEAGQGAARLGLYQIDMGDPRRPPAPRRVCGVPAQQPDAPSGGLTAGRLPPSVVEVQQAGGGDSGISPSLLLVSSGRGDISLVVQQSGEGSPSAAAALSPAVFPLRPAPPLQGVRPVHLAAAFLLPSSTTAPGASGQAEAALPAGQAAAAGMGASDICLILWSPRLRSNRHPSCCEVYAVRLAAADAAGAELVLHVRGVQLLKVSDLPPHGVLANPATGGVLLALQPSSASIEEEAAAQRAAAAATAAAAGAAGAGGAGPSTAGDEDEEDDVSPRTLAAAVARLAAYTSEEPVGALPHQQYADLYRETGADGVGAMGSEPTCTLFTFARAPEAGVGSVSSAAGAGADAAAGAGAGAAEGPPAAEGQLLRLVHTLSCQPHKLLTCHPQPPRFGATEPPTPDTHLPAGSVADVGQQQQGRQGPTSIGQTLLLGLTDDVDCAVVALSCIGGEQQGSQAPAAAGGGDGMEFPAVRAAGFSIKHVSSIPALAYVAAGKVQRKFLLLAPPGGDVAAALVEAGQYCYLYRSTSPRQEYGEHQVVDMELPDSSGRGLLGAVLAGCRAGACRLVLLAREGLRVIDM